MLARFFLATAALLSSLCGAAAVAQTAPPLAAAMPSVAVYSQTARELSVMQFQTATGTRLNNNTRHRLPVPDSALDKAVVILAGEALKKALPFGRQWLVAPTDTDLFESLLTVGEGEPVKFADDMLAALKEQGSTQLLLFTRVRDDASLRALNGRLGTGQLEGLGFYVDTHTPVRDVDLGQLGQGFLAPYAYFRSTLVDVASQRVLRTQVSRLGYVISAARSQGSAHPWDVMSSSQKMTTLRDMMRDEIGRVVPLLVAKP